MTTEPESLMQFPCDFPIKAFGIKSDQFEIDVLTIIRQYVPDIEENAINSRPSKDGKYLALTITVPVENKQQLDNIYQALTSCPSVLMAL
jgi:uncharacterized protein